jgi:phosphoribosylaminoimidazole-succinocarboxamide synthase
MIWDTPRVKLEGSVESIAEKIILETSLPGIERFSQGKVRDVYRIGDQLLIVATDRISAFDCVLPTGIPDKGRVLTQMSIFWFDQLRDLTATHFLTADVDAYPAELRPFRAQLNGRSMLVRLADMVPIECVARGYLAGSGWKEYRAGGTVVGIPLPKGLQESSRLPEPIFTPATKAQTGHDENISFEQMASIVGPDVARQLRDLTLAIYSRAASYAESRGIILADTKFEFGFIDGKLVLGDEVLTPDSSRFWPLDTYQPGRAQNSYDKQYVRDYLESIHWNKQPPAPVLPPEVSRETSAKYREAYRLLTGKEL